MPLLIVIAIFAAAPDGGIKQSAACRAADHAALEAICARLGACQGLVDQSRMRERLRRMGKSCDQAATSSGS